jgi:hypothetical protein
VSVDPEPDEEAVDLDAVAAGVAEDDALERKRGLVDDE